MSENIVYFKMKHEAQTYKIPIQGVNVQLKDLRQKIKDFLKMPQAQKGQSNQNFEELVIYGELEQNGGQEKALGLADKVRNKQTVVVVRQPYQQGQSLCESCLSSRSTSQTPCCQRRICQGCEEQFIKVTKCFFNELQQCPFKYVNYQVQTIKQQTEISNTELEQQIKNAVFFIVKSNTEQNVILAKTHDVWATTRRNFGTLMDQFNNKKVILIFIANRVEKFLGCAKMKNTQVPRDPKWQWCGTSTIQLADNFSIEWLRKGTVDFAKLQDTINPKTGDLVIRSKDCQEVPADIGQRICLLFEQIKQNDEEQEPQPQPQQEPTPQREDNEWEIYQIISPVNASPVREQIQQSPSRSPSNQNIPSQNISLNQAQHALLNQTLASLVQQQQMEINWNKMNVGKIPGLTGKVQYPHPFLQKYSQKQNKMVEGFLQMVQKETERKDKEKKSSSHSKKQKKKKDRDRSSSEEKRRSRKKSKERKDKKSKHKKRSRSRSRSRDHKKKKH
ncbi:unnamed protein product [Paramecium sonneborni]|uniref:YTH domain-containing protein n=1 Tax=Paramecium sonneborni TaxID=65129 RepID=A0A8S1KR92_9CILI|nr:unnamed protein product [Paramecium sonneborni]